MKAAPGAVKAFKYKAPAAPPPMHLNRLRVPKVDEGLTGVVDNQPATDIEERLARALDKYPTTQSYAFQDSYNAPRNVPGELRPDFVVYLDGGTAQPLQPDGEYAHKSAEAKERDRVKDAMLDEILRDSGALPTIRIPGDLLQNQPDADYFVRENLI